MKIHKSVFNLFQEITRIISKDGRDCIVVDPGFSDEKERKQFFDLLEKEGLKVSAVLITHGHYDHTAGAKDLQDAFGCPVYMSPLDIPVLVYNFELCGKLGLPIPDFGFRRTDVKDGDEFSAAGFSFKVIATPGHTPGGVCYLCEEDGFILTGDTLFSGTIGRTDLKYGEYDDIIVSVMDRLMILDAGLKVLPGHGPDTTIGYERINNPFLEPWGEKEETE